MADTPLSCATVINYTDDNYSSLVSEASASMDASGTQIQTTLNGLSGGGPITVGPSASAAANSGSTGVNAPASTVMGDSTASSATASSASGGGAAIAAQFGFVGSGVLGIVMLL